MRDAKAEVDVLTTRLQAWAAWLTAGGCAVGFPTKSVLHESWLPPAAGQTPSTPSVQAGDANEQRLHGIISAMCVRLQNTLVVVYVMRARPAEQVLWLQCQESTVRARVLEAKRAIAIELNRR